STLETCPSFLSSGPRTETPSIFETSSWASGFGAGARVSAAGAGDVTPGRAELAGACARADALNSATAEAVMIEIARIALLSVGATRSDNSLERDRVPIA